MREIMQEIKKVMEEKGVKPYQLYMKSPLSKSTISNLFRRDAFPRLDTYLFICEALHESPCRFLCDHDCKNPTPEEMRLLQLFNELDEPYKAFVLEALEKLAAAGEKK